MLNRVEYLYHSPGRFIAGVNSAQPLRGNSRNDCANLLIEKFHYNFQVVWIYPDLFGMAMKDADRFAEGDN